MPKPVLERIRDYFQDIADVMAGDKSASSVFPNTSDAGMTREEVLKRFLEDHLPKRCEVIKGGFIFDSVGNESGQIDLLVTNDIALRFMHAKKSFSYIEGCFAAISVKSKLTKSTVFEALDNISSIPPTPILIPDAGRKISSEDWQIVPVKIIFAYDSLKLDTISKHITHYYGEHKDIPWHKRPDIIVVNNKWIIIYTGNRALSTRSGNLVEPHTFFPMARSEYTGAHCLMMMLSRIQAVAKLGTKIDADFSQYVDKMF